MIELKKDIEKFREKAGVLIDQEFARRAQRNPYLLAIHSVKLALATQVKHAQASGQNANIDAPALLGNEAALRGVTIGDLADTIIANGQQHFNTLQAMEVERQEARALIRNAKSVEEMDALIGSYGVSFTTDTRGV